MPFRFVASVLIAASVTACSNGPRSLRDHAEPVATTRLTRVAPGVSLEVLDWGGTGPALVFLAGSGSTAHVFDEFAPQFADSFHVVGITRRGFGASAGSPPPRELDTLVADIAAVLDSLAVTSAVFAGHSIAGEEMTRFAELHPERCQGLVYIDAAYDRTGIDTMAAWQPPQPPPRIRAADTATFASLRALYARAMGVQTPASEIRAIARFDSRDRYLGDVTPYAVRAQLLDGSTKARYDRVHCPALGIYAVADSLADVVPYYSELDARGRAQADALLKFVQAVVDDGRARFARYPQNTVVDVRGSNHFVFLQRPVDVARAMRVFLSRLRRRIFPI